MESAVLKWLEMARIDIKNQGEGNDVKITVVGGEHCRVTHPQWFSNGGIGYVLESSDKDQVVELECHGNGTLMLRLMGMDKRGKNDNRLPLWVDYTRLAVNKEVIFQEVKSQWHDKQYVYTRQVRDGEKLQVEVSWSTHGYRGEELSALLSLMDVSPLNLSKNANNKDLKKESFRLKTIHETFVYIDKDNKLVHKEQGIDQLNEIYAEHMDGKLCLFVLTKDGYPFYLQHIDGHGKAILGAFPHWFGIIRNKIGSVSLEQGTAVLCAKDDGSFALKKNHIGSWEQFFLKNQQKMVLYLIDHPGVLLKVLLHKMHFHKEDLAHFLVYPASYNHPAFVRLREKFMWQMGIVTMKELSPKYAGKKGWDIDKTREVMITEYDKEMRRMDIHLNDFKEVYLYEDMQISFEVYCLLKNYKYSIYEAVGNCSWQIRDNISADDPSMRILLNHLLKETDDPIKKIYSSYRKSGRHPYHEGWEFFDFKNAFMELNEEEKHLIFDIFECNSLNFLTMPINLYSTDSCLRETNFYSVYYSEAYSMNEMLLDYFYSKDDVVVKPHPKSDQKFMKYDNKVSEIPYYIPAEILCLIPEFKINDLLTGMTTSTQDLQTISKRSLHFGQHYQEFSPYFHKVYFATRFICENDVQEPTIHYVGMSKLDIDLISKMECVQDGRVKLKKWEGDNGVFLFMGSRMEREKMQKILEAVKYSTMVFFVMGVDDMVLDLNKKGGGMLKEFIFNIIKKKPFREKYDIKLDSEALFMYCKNKACREKYLRYSALNKLPYSGVEIAIEAHREFESNIVLNGLRLTFLEKMINNK